MPTPQFIVDLRRHIGNAPLFLPAVRSVVFRDHRDPTQVLLAKRADNGAWHLPAGFMEPGEQPGTALVREVLEETGVRIEIDRLVSLITLPAATYPNGDQVQCLSCTFRAHYLSGEAHVADDESTAVGWYDLDRLPPNLNAEDRDAIRAARAVEAAPNFAI